MFFPTGNMSRDNVAREFFLESDGVICALLSLVESDTDSLDISYCTVAASGALVNLATAQKGQVWYYFFLMPCFLMLYFICCYYLLLLFVVIIGINIYLFMRETILILIL